MLYATLGELASCSHPDIDEGSDPYGKTLNSPSLKMDFLPSRTDPKSCELKQNKAGEFNLVGVVIKK